MGIMGTVESWLKSNVATMSAVRQGDVNPSFRHKNMVLHYTRIQGKVAQFKYSKEGLVSSHASMKSMYKDDEVMQLTMVDMIIDIPD